MKGKSWVARSSSGEHSSGSLDVGTTPSPFLGTAATATPREVEYPNTRNRAIMCVDFSLHVGGLRM